MKAPFRGADGVRLLWQQADGSEHLQDFATVTEAREAVTPEMVDWVVVERVRPGKYATAGRVLDASDGVARCKMCDVLLSEHGESVCVCG